MHRDRSSRRYLASTVAFAVLAFAVVGCEFLTGAPGEPAAAFEQPEVFDVPEDGIVQIQRILDGETFRVAVQDASGRAVPQMRVQYVEHADGIMYVDVFDPTGEYATYSFVGDYQALMDEVANADAVALPSGAAELSPQLLCGGLCLTAAVVALGAAQVGVLSGVTKVSGQRVTDVRRIEAVDEGGFVEYCKTPLEIAGYLEGQHQALFTMTETGDHLAIDLFIEVVDKAGLFADSVTKVLPVLSGAGIVYGVYETYHYLLEIEDTLGDLYEPHADETKYRVRIHYHPNESSLQAVNRRVRIVGLCGNDEVSLDETHPVMATTVPGDVEAGRGFDLRVESTAPASTEVEAHLLVVRDGAIDDVLERTGTTRLVGGPTATGSAVTLRFPGVRGDYAVLNVYVPATMSSTYRYLDLTGGDASTAPTFSTLRIDPTTATPGETVTLSVQAFDPESEALECTLDWGDDSPASAFGCGTLQTRGHEYATSGAYVITVEVSDGLLTAEDTLDITIGTVEQRPDELTVCDTWKAAGSGGAGITVDTWDVSVIPSGAAFDIRFDAYGLPDRFVIAYENSIVWRSGWRGDAYHDGDPDYPGGIAGPGVGEALDLFSKQTTDEMVVQIEGVDPGTAWNYSVRCRTP